MGIINSTKRHKTVTVADEVTTRKRDAPNIHVSVGNHVNVTGDLDP